VVAIRDQLLGSGNVLKTNTARFSHVSLSRPLFFLSNLKILERLLKLQLQLLFLQMTDKSGIACALLIMLSGGLAFNIASIVVAVGNPNDACEGHDKTGVSLYAWLLVTGIVGLAMTVLFGCTAYGYFAEENECCAVFGFIAQILSGMFFCAWFILGIVIVARSHAKCVDDSTPIGVMTTIMLVIQGLAVCAGCCNGAPRE
jgi:hypothetical protein